MQNFIDQTPSNERVINVDLPTAETFQVHCHPIAKNRANTYVLIDHGMVRAIESTISASADRPTTEAVNPTFSAGQTVTIHPSYARAYLVLSTAYSIPYRSNQCLSVSAERPYMRIVSCSLC